MRCRNCIGTKTFPIVSVISLCEEVLVINCLFVLFRVCFLCFRVKVLKSESLTLAFFPFQTFRL